MIEQQIEQTFIDTLVGLKYEYRSDITDRAALEHNFREKFEALNRVHLTDGEFSRLLDEIVPPDVFTAARFLRQINSFTRYISTAVAEEEISLEVTNAQLLENEAAIQAATQKHNEFLKELGQPVLP